MDRGICIDLMRLNMLCFVLETPLLTTSLLHTRFPAVDHEGP